MIQKMCKSLETYDVQKLHTDFMENVQNPLRIFSIIEKDQKFVFSFFVLRNIKFMFLSLREYIYMPQEPFLDDFIKYGSFSKIEIFLGYFRVRSLKNLGSTFFKQSLVNFLIFFVRARDKHITCLCKVSGPFVE